VISMKVCSFVGSTAIMALWRARFSACRCRELVARVQVEDRLPCPALEGARVSGCPHAQQPRHMERSALVPGKI
jgi:hypothetical protein